VEQRQTVALALAVIGVYGVVSYAVARRSREVGMALGAESGAIVRLLMREGLVLVAVGAGLGVAGRAGSASVHGEPKP